MGRDQVTQLLTCPVSYNKSRPLGGIVAKKGEEERLPDTRQECAYGYSIHHKDMLHIKDIIRCLSQQ